MKQLKKYILALLLVVAAFPAFAEIAQVDLLRYDFDSESATARCLGIASSGVRYLIIPDTVVYKGFTYTVTSIVQYAFAGNEVISVTIPATIEEIGHAAFNNCTGLKDIWCYVEEPLVIDDSVFSDYSANLHVSEGSVDLYRLDEEWGKFKDIYSLEYGIVSDSDHVVINGIEYFCPKSRLTKASITKGVECSGSVILPDSVVVNGRTYKVAKIEKEAFSGCGDITSLVISDSIEEISDEAFCNCTGLKKLKIGDSVITIGSDILKGCSRLTSITIGKSLPYLAGAFREDLPLREVHISDLKAWCGLNFYTSFYYYDRSHSHSECFETNNPLHGASLYLDDKPVTYLDIPDGVKAIGKGAFIDYDNISWVKIPDSVKSIGYFSFYRCSGLTSLTIGKSVTQIGAYAFKGCSLASVYCACKTPPAVNKYKTFTVDLYDSYDCVVDEVFDYYDGILYVPVGCRVSYMNHPLWGKFKTIVESEELGNYDVNTVNINGLRYYCNPDSGTAKLKDGHDCSGDIIIAEEVSLDGREYKVTAISAGAFKEVNIKSVSIPNSVNSVGGNAFKGCSSLSSVRVGNSVTSIGENAFSDCTSLKEVHISDIAAWCGIDFYDINSNPLSYARNLYMDGELTTDPVIREGVGRIKNYAFYNCSNLTSVTIPSSVSYIGEKAFDSCGIKNLTCHAIYPPGCGIVTLDYDYRDYPPDFDFDRFNYSPFGCCLYTYDITLYVPSSSLDIYSRDIQKIVN